MDRIKKFIRNKPSKNHRIIEYNNKEYKITKKDVQDIRQYKQNKCLTTLDLYMPLSTVFSRETRSDALNVNFNKHDSRRRTADFIERMKKYEKKIPKNVNELTNIWDGNLDAKHRVEIDLKPLSCKYNEIRPDIKVFMRGIEDKYFREPIVRHKIENLIPQMPKEVMHDTASELAMYYKYNEAIRTFSQNHSKDKFCVGFEHGCKVYEYVNHRKIAEYNFEYKINKVICCDKHTVISHGKCVTLSFYKSLEFQLDENLHVKYTYNNIHLTLEHADEIKDFTCKNNLLVVITGRKILIHNTETYQTIQPFKLKTEQALKIKIRQNELLIAACNTFYIYDLKTRAFTVKLSNLFTYPHSFDHVNGYIFIVDKENRITIMKDNRLIKIIQQLDYIVNIVVHKKINQFVVVYKTKYSVFGYDEYGCKLLRTVDHKTKKMMFHESLNWLFVTQNKQLQIYV